MKIKDVLEDKKYIISSMFLKNIVSLNLSLNEFLLLIYLINDENKLFDINKIVKSIYLKENITLEALNSLIEKKLISIDSVKNDKGKIMEIINLEGLYATFNEQIKSELSVTKREDIFTIFEKEFGRTITAMEYEIINAWMEKDFSEEIILAALKEAVYNGVTNLRYIDKILYEWQKKGFKNAKDVDNHIKNKTKDNKQKELFDYNWLDDESE
ncbi:MAG: DnaD domain protein [Bacilli bacterium]|nr:DnaD domain protein [Bacilli bacterium]